VVQHRAGDLLSVAMEFIPERGEPDIDLSALVVTIECAPLDEDGYVPGVITVTNDATHIWYSIASDETALMSGAYELAIVTDAADGGQRRTMFVVTYNVTASASIQ